MRIPWPVCFLVLVHCGGSTLDETCQHRSGEYRVYYEKLSGSCDDVAVQVVNEDLLVLGCWGRIDTRSDNCENRLELTCREPELGTGYLSETTGSVEWDHEGALGTGVVKRVVRNAEEATVCQGSYEVTYAQR